ncbi:glycosyltransferase family 4 protein [Halopenitus persicus]|uniref:Glycosyltransferase involved in cell wall bisynthesis n=1 Tax=Halopenitus persicus TaxID=1048396 RepID=A0A1H3IZ58_9EURY|nr:glycosyltransferase family 1 protein [Halopenitus persicus]SDY32991.1 Glycosyltransferase involved in cell wall bisynthesis [Halopenitus persicus]
MKVAINTLSHVTGGGITYFENVLPRLADDGDEYLVLVPAGRDKITRVDASNIRFVETSFPVGFLLGRLFYEQVVFPLLLWYWDVDVLLSPADLTPLLAPCPSVLAIRNPNPYFRAPDLDRTRFRRVKFRLQRYLTWLAARKASEVFFVSEFSRDISAETLGLPAEKTHVVYHGLDRSLFEEPAVPDDELRDRIGANKPYLLTISTINEHKNYETLLRGYARLPERIRSEYDLLVAGRNSAPEYFDRLQEICRNEGIDKQVQFLGEVDYEYVPYLYQHASLYVLPSKLETFGHTLVEAMASGTPIVAADATCIPEIVDGAAVLFDPDSPTALADSIEAVLTEETRRDDLVARGTDRVTEFSWDRTVDRTKALLTTAAQSTGETELHDD